MCVRACVRVCACVRACVCVCGDILYFLQGGRGVGAADKSFLSPHCCIFFKARGEMGGGGGGGLVSCCFLTLHFVVVVYPAEKGWGTGLV